MASCRLLKLPAELRNQIYELAFQTTIRNQPVDLLWAEPPSAALLLCCRQIYQEAKTNFLEASRHYWSVRHCEIDGLRLSKRAKEHLSELQTQRRLQDIKHLTIRTRGVVSRYGWASMDLSLVHTRGGWKRTVNRNPGRGQYTRSEDYVFVVPDEGATHRSLQAFTTAEELKTVCSEQTTVVSMEMQILAAIAMLEQWVAVRNA